MRASHFCQLVFLFSVVTACSSQPSAKDLAKELETVKSWTATAEMVGESWLKQSIPTVYAKQTLQATQAELQKETETVKKVAPNQARGEVVTKLQQIEQTVSQLELAVEKDDRANLSQLLQQLSMQKRTLDTISSQETRVQPNEIVGEQQ